MRWEHSRKRRRRPPLTIEITPEKAAAFTLSRHHLLERTPSNEAIEVIDDILGLNAQGALNYQISLWNRVADLNRDYIAKALYGDRSLVRSWLMRDTVHIIPSASLPLFRKALTRGLMGEWNRWTVRTGAKETPESWEPLYPQVLDALADEPLTLNQLLEKVGWTGTNAKWDLHRLVREMSLRGLLCNAESSGPWYHNTQHAFPRVDRWLPRASLEGISEEEAKANLVKMYLKAYGSASVSDFAYWSGMRVRDAKPVFDDISDSLAEVVITGQRATTLVLEDDVSELLATDEEVHQARLLPQFDALIMGHRDKTRFLALTTKGSIFLPRANVSATMMLDGWVKGVWKMKKERRAWKLELSPFEELGAEEREMVDEEVEGLRRFTGFEIEAGWTET